MQFITRAACAALLLACALPALALGQKSFVAFERPAGDTVALVQSGAAAKLFLDPADHTGVLRAAGDLQGDILRVSGVRPVLQKGGAMAAPGGLRTRANPPYVVRSFIK